MQRTRFYGALTQSSRLFRLPYSFAVPFLGGAVIPFIWSVSVVTAAWAIFVYVACRVVANRDEKIVEVHMNGFRQVPNTRTRKMFGGDSYGC